MWSNDWNHTIHTHTQTHTKLDIQMWADFSTQFIFPCYILLCGAGFRRLYCHCSHCIIVSSMLGWAGNLQTAEQGKLNRCCLPARTCCMHTLTQEMSWFDECMLKGCGQFICTCIRQPFCHWVSSIVIWCILRCGNALTPATSEDLVNKKYRSTC